VHATSQQPRRWRIGCMRRLHAPAALADRVHATVACVGSACGSGHATVAARPAQVLRGGAGGAAATALAAATGAALDRDLKPSNLFLRLWSGAAQVVPLRPLSKKAGERLVQPDASNAVALYAFSMYSPASFGLPRQPEAPGTLP
jgi:hypothetical protein